MIARKTFTILFLLAGMCTLQSQNQQDSLIFREYRLVVGQPYESKIFATADLNIYKGFQDIYQRGIAPHLPPKLNAVTEVRWPILSPMFLFLLI